MRLSLWISLVGCALGLPGSDLAARDFHECVVTYGDFNTVNHIAGSMSHVYFATTSGVTRYDKMQDRWMDPLPHHGLDDDDIQRVWVDVFDQRLLARTSAGLFEYESMRSRWSPVAELPPGPVHLQPRGLPGQSAGSVLLLHRRLRR